MRVDVPDWAHLHAAAAWAELDQCWSGFEEKTMWRYRLEFQDPLGMGSCSLEVGRREVHLCVDPVMAVNLRAKDNLDPTADCQSPLARLGVHSKEGGERGCNLDAKRNQARTRGLLEAIENVG